MTVPSPYTPPQYTGNGVTTVFSFSSPFFDPSELIVDLFNTSTNAAVAPAAVLNGAATYDYTVAGTKDPNTGEYLSGGLLTFNTAPPGNFRITIYRRVVAQQNVALGNNTSFPAKTVEGALDRAMLILQQLLASAALTLVAPIADVAPNMILPPALSRASKYLMFDASGNVAVASLPVLSTISAAASQEVRVTQSAGADNETRLVNADAAAVILGGVVVLDCNATLTANRTFAAPRIRMAGGVITRGAFNLTFSGMVDCPDYIAFTEISGAGNVTFANASCSLAWFGAKQDTTPLGATVTDNTVAWQKCCAAGSGGQIRVPLLNPAKAYAITTGATITGPTEVKSDELAYLQHQGAGYCATYQGGGSAIGMNVNLRVYGSSSGAGAVKYDSNTGYITDSSFVYGYTNGEAFAFFGTTFDYTFLNVTVRNCKRFMKSYAGYAQTTNRVVIDGGKFQIDGTCAGDVNGMIQLDRGNGWKITGKPNFALGHATPIPLFKLSQITPTDAGDTQIQNFAIDDMYLEGNYTSALVVGRDAAGNPVVYPSSLQQPRDIYATLLQVNNAATVRLVDISQVFGAGLQFGYNIAGQLFRYDAGCDCISVRLQQDTGSYTVNTSATNTRIESTRSVSLDNNTTSIIYAGGLQLPTGRTITGGNNSPEGVVTAPVGSEYHRSNGGAATSLYVKETGAGNTGWVGK